MSDYYLIKTAIIANGENYRYFVKNTVDGDDGITIEYQEQEYNEEKDAYCGEFKTKTYLSFYPESAKLLKSVLNEYVDD